MKRRRILCYSVLALCIMLLSSCRQREFKRGYYRYPIGYIKIEKPQLIAFMHEENAFFVCPDSAVPHCTEKQWRERKDVYRLALSLCRYYQEVTDERPPLYIRDNLLYLNGCVEEINDSIWRSEFVMKPQKFKVYMEADCLYWYDPSDPERINPDADSYDVFAYNEQFSITVRPQFSLLDRYLYERRMRQE